MAFLQTRRNFVRAVPLAAGVLLPLTGTASRPEAAAAQPAPPQPVPFQVFPRQALDGMVAGLKAAPGAKDLVTAPELAVSMTVSVEEKKSGKEFEYHQHRDHVFQVLEGTTVYHLGGTPKNARQTRPGEWLAPDSEGFTTVTLHKGDLLTIPRMTPHKRITEDMVGLLLISATTPA